MPRKDVNRKEGQTSIERNPGKNPARAGRPSGGGKHFRDAPTGPSNLERNPGIGTSPGTFSSGESGVDGRDEGPGITPRQR